jgi:uncharacterized membrane protein
VELFFGYAISRRVFRERVTRTEFAGMVLLAIGLIIVSVAR